MAPAALVFSENRTGVPSSGSRQIPRVAPGELQSGLQRYAGCRFLCRTLFESSLENWLDDYRIGKFGYFAKFWHAEAQEPRFVCQSLKPTETVPPLQWIPDRQDNFGVGELCHKLAIVYAYRKVNCCGVATQESFSVHSRQISCGKIGPCLQVFILKQHGFHVIIGPCQQYFKGCRQRCCACPAKACADYLYSIHWVFQ